MKIVLVKPRYFDHKHRFYFTICIPPIGLTYLASSLLEAGHDVSILDMEALRMDESGFYRYLKENNPDIVGIDVRTPLVNKAAKLASITKEYSNDIKVVIGGPHLFIMPKDALEIIKNADFGLRGECEYTLVELIEGISLNKNFDELQNIEGICYRLNDNFFISDKVPLIKDLNILPMPAHYLLPIEKYFDDFVRGEKYYSIMTARGCRYRCIFCGQALLYGRKMRIRSVANVLEEIEILVKKYDIRYISFVDATFNYSIERAISICREIIKRKLRFDWRIKARVDLVNYEMLSLMKEAGCKLISYGVESASNDTLKYLKKGYTINDVRYAFKLTKEVGINICGYFLLGSLNESKNDCLATIKFAKELNPLFAQFMFPLPLPGTELYQNLKKKNILVINWDRYYFHFLNYKHPCISRKELKKLYVKANFDFYFRFSYFLQQIKISKGWNDLLRKAKIGIIAFIYLLRDKLSKK